MKRRALLLASAGLAGGATARGERVTWPDGVTLLDGSAWTPKPGQAQIIVRWATWCGFCRRHNAQLNALVRSLPTDAPLQVLGVATDRDAEAVRRHVQAEGLAFPVTLDASRFSALSPKRLIPLTITVDRLGRLQEIIPGEMAHADVMNLANLAR